MKELLEQPRQLPKLIGVEVAPGRIEFMEEEVPTIDLQPAQTAPTHVTEPPIPHYVELTRRQKFNQWLEDYPVRKFDKDHDTDLYSELLLKRRKDAILAKAAEIGLFDTRSDSYKAQLNRLAKTSV
jgi:hypothetical protein